MAITPPCRSSKSSASWFISEIEKFEKKELEGGLKDGSVPNIKEMDYRLLLEEIEFFITKRDQLLTQNESLLLEQQKLDESKTDAYRLQEIKRTVMTNQLSVKFFERQISVAMHDYRVLENKRKNVCFFLKDQPWTMEQFRQFVKAHDEKKTQKVLS